MKTAVSSCLAALLMAAAPAAPDAGFEDPRGLPASHFLSPEELAGPGWRVEPEAVNDGFTNTYTLVSSYGTWPARGRVQLAERIREIRALARLDEVSKSKVFLDAVESSVTAPVELVRSVAERPAETLKGIPEGVGRWLKKTRFRVEETYHDVKERADRKEDGPEAGEEAERVSADEVEDLAKREARKRLQVTGAERRWYADLGVDPYTDNELLRRAVLSVARVDGLTRFGMKLVALPRVPGAKEMDRAMELVWSTDPWELRRRNRKLMLAAGLSEDTARAFEDNPALSLSVQTALLDILDGFAAVAGRQHLIARALDVASREEARGLVASTALLLEHHRGREPLAAFLPGARLPVARTVDGELVAMLPADAVFWTADMAEAAESFAGLYADETASVRRFMVAGEASDRFAREAGKLGWEVVDRWPEDRTAATQQPPAGP